MNAVTETAANAIAGLQGLAAGIANVQQSIHLPGGDPFMRLVNGRWVYGQENLQVEEGSLWAVDPRSIQHGWVCWTDYPKEAKKKNEVVGEKMVSSGDPLPPRPATTDDGWEWAQQLSITLACTNGEDAGTQVQYKTTSDGGMRAVREFLGELGQQLNEDISKPVAVLELGVDSYNHKVWGETFTPEFIVNSWVALDATEVAPKEQEAEPEAQAEAPAEPKAETTEASPRRRRRRA